MNLFPERTFEERLQIFQKVFVVFMIMALFAKSYFLAFSYGATSVIFYSLLKSFKK